MGKNVIVPWQGIIIFALPTFYLFWIRPRNFTCDMLFNSCIDHGQGDCWIDTRIMIWQLKNCLLC